MKKHRRHNARPAKIAMSSKKNPVHLKMTAGIIILLILITLAGIKWHHQIKLKETHKKAVALGLYTASSEIEERHVWISEHVLTPGKGGEVPVHIMFRKNSREVWQLVGTGARLSGKYTNSILTAYHVFEEYTGQHGCRKIGPSEFTGNEPIIPIMSINSARNADDAVLCTIDPESRLFPTLSAPLATNMFNGFKPGRTFKTDSIDSRVRFGTYPEVDIRGLTDTVVDNGAHHVLLNWLPLQGESGTVAQAEGAPDGIYLVVISQDVVYKSLYDQLPEGHKKRFVGWTESKHFGNAVVVKVR
ncbi:MAG: hypothetical protein WCO79_01875 [bacterium]